MASLFALPALAQGNGGVPNATPGGCYIRINAAPSAWIIEGYDPFSGYAAEGTYSVVFLNDSTKECAFYPSFELTQPPFGLSRGTGQPIPYAILDLGEARDVTPRAGRTLRQPSARRIVLSANESKSVLYKLVAQPREGSDAGTFTQDLTIEAQDDNFRSLGGATLVVGLTIQPSARIGLAGAYSFRDGQAVVDLGALRPGPAPVPLHLRVNSTGAYEISVTSANSGHLRLGSSEWSIPYAIAIGDQRLNLSGPRTISSSSTSGHRRDSLPLNFVIGDVADKRAGYYSDTISIAVAAR